MISDTILRGYAENGVGVSSIFCSGLLTLFEMSGVLFNFDKMRIIREFGE
jgi:hypothetical protein